MRLRLITFCLVILIPVVAFAGDYVVGEGDGLDIGVWGVKELNFSVRVRPDGKITVPGLGDIVASGFTSKELQNELAKKLKELVKNPIVTVTVREVTNSKVYVFGGGISSGVHELNRRTTLLQLLCLIGNTAAGGGANGTHGGGGVASSSNGKVADYKNAYILRKGKKIKENFYRLFINGDVSEDITIETNDAIFIPQLLEKNIYVLGAVNIPKVIEYHDGMTAMEAILEAGGFTKFAKQNDTSILRKDGQKDITIPIKAKDLLQDGDLGQNVKLKAGDYIIVKEGIF